MLSSFQWISILDVSKNTTPRRTKLFKIKSCIIQYSNSVTRLHTELS